MSGIGILGIGAYLPPEVRTNDWWPAETVARWMEARARQLAALRDAPPPATPAMAAVIGAMTSQAADPFRGIRERRVLSPALSATDMEAAASCDALARADVAPSEIDLLLVHSAVPEHLLANAACTLHHRLELPTRCLALEAQASAYSFLGQLALADGMLLAGRARFALLVQSTVASRLIDRDDPVSPAFGDGATAVVVGARPTGLTLLASTHRADGRIPDSLVASVRGGRWHDGIPHLHVANPAGERQLMLETVDHGVDVISDVLASVDRSASEVSFFASHQGTSWLRRLTQEHAGLDDAASLDLFPETGYLFASSIPLVLGTASERGLLRRDTLALLFGGGTGITYGATLTHVDGDIR